MPECEYCDKWYRNNKELNQHITKMHIRETKNTGAKSVDITVDPFNIINEMDKSHMIQSKKNNHTSSGHPRTSK